MIKLQNKLNTHLRERGISERVFVLPNFSQRSIQMHPIQRRTSRNNIHGPSNSTERKSAEDRRSDCEYEKKYIRYIMYGKRRGENDLFGSKCAITITSRGKKNIFRTTTSSNFEYLSRRRSLRHFTSVNKLFSIGKRRVKKRYFFLHIN